MTGSAQRLWRVASREPCDCTSIPRLGLSVQSDNMRTDMCIACRKR